MLSRCHYWIVRMNMGSLGFIAVGLLAVVGSSSCSGAGPVGLAGTGWILDSSTPPAGQSRPAAMLLLKSGPAYQLQLEAGRIVVRNGCNDLQASYRGWGEHIEVTRVEATLRACDDRAVMASDRQMQMFLESLSSARVAPGEVQLTLASPLLTLHFVRVL